MKGYMRVATAAIFAVVTGAPAFAGPVGVALPSPAAQTAERLDQAREQVVRERGPSPTSEGRSWSATSQRKRSSTT
jgi:hypothetical protein